MEATFSISANPKDFNRTCKSTFYFTKKEIEAIKKSEGNRLYKDPLLKCCCSSFYGDSNERDKDIKDQSVTVVENADEWIDLYDGFFNNILYTKIYRTVCNLNMTRDGLTKTQIEDKITTLTSEIKKLQSELSELQKDLIIAQNYNI